MRHESQCATDQALSLPRAFRAASHKLFAINTHDDSRTLSGKGNFLALKLQESRRVRDLAFAAVKPHSKRSLAPKPKIGRVPVSQRECF